MHLRFPLESSAKHLLNVDLLDTYLDLLDADILSKHFFCLQDVFKTSSRYVFKTSSMHVFKTSSIHVFKVTSINVFKRSWRGLHRNNFSSSKTSSRCRTRCFQDVFARRLEDILKIIKYLLGIFQIGLKKLLRWLKKVKILCRGNMLLVTLTEKKLFRYFTKKELQKTNQKKFQVEKQIKRKGDKLYLKWEGCDSLFNSWIDKKDIM